MYKAEDKRNGDKMRENCGIESEMKPEMCKVATKCIQN